MEKQKIKKFKVASPNVALREEFFLKERTKWRWPATNDVISSPSASTTLGKAFPECMIFGSRGRQPFL